MSRALTYLEPILTCRAKRLYSTAAEAHRARKGLLRRRRMAKTYVYRCRVCSGFHLASDNHLKRRLWEV